MILMSLLINIKYVFNFFSIILLSILDLTKMVFSDRTDQSTKNIQLWYLDLINIYQKYVSVGIKLYKTIESFYIYTFSQIIKKIEYNSTSRESLLLSYQF